MTAVSGLAAVVQFIQGGRQGTIVSGQCGFTVSQATAVDDGKQATAVDDGKRDEDGRPRRPSTEEKHTKPRLGRNTKQRQKPGWRQETPKKKINEQT